MGKSGCLTVAVVIALALLIAFAIGLLRSDGGSAANITGEFIQTAAQGPTARGSSVPAGSLAEARSGYTTTLLLDGRVLVVGGWGDTGSLASAEVWDPVTMAFSPAGSLAEARSEHSAVLLPGGLVLVLGGWGPDGLLGSAELWDPATETFSPAGSLLRSRSDYRVTALPDGRVLVVGGSVSDAAGNEAIPVRMAEVWDPTTLSFSSAGSLGRVRHRVRYEALALPDGGVLVVGGGKRLAERWDPVSMSFEAAGKMTKPRSETTLLSDGKVLVVGVFDPITCGPGKRYASTPDAETWDPDTRSFSPAGAFRRPRNGASTVLLSDGRVLFVGGYDAVCMSVPTLRSAEVWDPVTRSFGRTGRPRVPREDHTTTLLSDGRVALIGGVASPGCGRKDTRKCRDVISGSVELWDPSTRLFSPGKRLIHARAGHTATLLEGGSILVVGGRGPDGQTLASAELWSPGP